MIAERRTLSGLSVLIALAACSMLEPEQAEVSVYEVEHYGVECGGEGLHLCLLARAPGEGAFKALFPLPTGFEYRWGFRYTIEVIETPISNPPADGSAIRRRLRSVRSSERVAVGTDFSVALTGGVGRVEQTGDTRFRIYDVAEFECPVDLRCDELGAALTGGRRVMLDMRHDEPGEPIMLVGWSEA